MKCSADAPKAIIDETPKSDDWTAVPVVVLSEATLKSPDAIIDALNDFAKLDDVFCKDFMTDTIVANGFPKEQSVARVRAIIAARDWNVRKVFELKAQPQQPTIPDGPYFMIGNELHQAWRLYPDHLDAFASTITSSEDDSMK